MAHYDFNMPIAEAQARKLKVNDTDKAYLEALHNAEITQSDDAFKVFIDDLKAGEEAGLDPKMQALLHVARIVARRALDLTSDDVEAATSAGATDGDVQLAVLIAAAFSMYNRMVDGLRARTAAEPEAYDARAAEIARTGYSAPAALPPAARPAASATR